MIIAKKQNSLRGCLENGNYIVNLPWEARETWETWDFWETQCISHKKSHG